MEDHKLMEDDDYLDLTDDERTLATLSHLGNFIGIMLPGLGNILLPFLIWFFKKGESDYVARHAKEALNFQLTISTLFVVAAIMMVFVVGFFIMPILVLICIAFSISAATKAKRGEFYDYPLNFRWIK